MTTSAPFRRCACGSRLFRISPSGEVSCSECSAPIGDRLQADGTVETFTTEEWEDLFAAAEERCRVLETAIRRTGQQVEIVAWSARLAVTQGLRAKLKTYVPTAAPKGSKKRKFKS